MVLERETGLEPATSSLGSWHSTTELLPLNLHRPLASWSLFYAANGLAINRSVESHPTTFMGFCGPNAPGRLLPLAAQCRRAPAVHSPALHSYVGRPTGTRHSRRPVRDHFLLRAQRPKNKLPRT